MQAESKLKWMRDLQRAFDQQGDEEKFFSIYTREGACTVAIEWRNTFTGQGGLIARINHSRVVQTLTQLLIELQRLRGRDSLEKEQEAMRERMEKRKKRRSKTPVKRERRSPSESFGTRMPWPSDYNRVTVDDAMERRRA